MNRKSSLRAGFLVVAALFVELAASEPLLSQEDHSIVPGAAALYSTEGLEANARENDNVLPPMYALPSPSAETAIEGTPETIAEVDDTSDESPVSFGDWLGYNSAQDDTTWIADRRFGMFSIESFPTLEVGKGSDLMVGTGFHFLNGPAVPDMPPRLFDFQLAYQTRRATEKLIFDVKLGVGAFSDFEGSAREGIRFPGHAVSYHEWHPQFVTVLGVEVLDRDDISVLPVGGVVWRPIDDLVCEFVFPRPRLQVQLDSDHAAYIGGELGGGTWAIERVDRTNDNVTYRDLQVVLGITNFNNDNSVFEIGWAFDRKLEYRSGAGNYQPDDALILRIRAHF